MKKKIKKSLSLLLILTLSFSLMLGGFMNVSAEDDEVTDNSSDEIMSFSTEPEDESTDDATVENGKDETVVDDETVTEGETVVDDQDLTAEEDDPVVVGELEDEEETATEEGTDEEDYGIQTLSVYDDAIYLNGVSGDDNNEGTLESPVATFAKAKELAVEEDFGAIRITDTVTVTDTESWDGNLTFYRDESFTTNDLVIVGDKGNLTLSNITIDDNKVSETSSLVKVEGDGALLTINDGTVIQNNDNRSGNLSNPGAVCVRNGKLVMKGGTITKNDSDGFAGGVALYANSPNSAEMEFYGGTISNNKQTEHEAYGGGGIYVNSAQAVSGVQCEAGHLYIYNVEITDNKVTTTNESYLDTYNSTIASCETGSIEVNVTDGDVIHDNTEGYTFFVYELDDSELFTLSPIMLGGGAYNWVDENETLLDLDDLTFNHSGFFYATTKVSTSDNTVTGLDRCYTKMVGNEAVVMGSAIGTNGDVTIGKEDGDVSIEISKIWDISVNEKDYKPVDVNVYATDGSGNTTIIGKVTLDEENNWSTTIEHLPKYDYDMSEFTYSIEEDLGEDASINGWVSIVSGGETKCSGSDYNSDEEKTAEYEYTITNASEEVLPELHKYVSDPAFDESVDEHLSSDEADNNNTMEYMIEIDTIYRSNDFVIHDYLDDQLDINTLDPDTIKVVLHTDKDDKTGTELVYEYKETYGECSDPNCGLGGKCSFEVAIDDDYLTSLGVELTEESYITITFDIDLKESTDDYDENLTDEIDNYAGLSYTFMGISGYAAPDEVETYSYGFNIFKYTGDDTPLAEAKFVLAKDSGEEMVYAQLSQNDNIYMLIDWTTDKSAATEMISVEDEYITVEGLHEGEYLIEEVEAPEGFEQLEDPIAVTIKADEDYIPTITADSKTVDNHTVSIKNEPSSSTYEIPGEDEEDNDIEGTPTASSSNEPDEEPVTETYTVKTNDNTNMLIYVAGLGLSLAVLLGIAYSRRKRNYNN